MKYSAIDIQGNILSSDIFEKIRLEDIRYQKPIDFGLDRNATVREEINLAWTAARSFWTAFSIRREKLKEEDTGTTLTRQSWLIPLLRELGYNLSNANAENVQGKSYAVSHRDGEKERLPVHLVGIQQSLDKRPKAGQTRLSPHGLVQEYLNQTEHLYGLVSNGKYLRLLRDATRLTRLSYLEFNLEQIMEEELFAEFALLYRSLHASRMPKTAEDGAESVIEFYHQEALNAGSRIRAKLSEAVEESIKQLANGLLKQNPSLNERIEKGEYDAQAFYQHLLRTIYRILFLLVIEARNLIYSQQRDEQVEKHRQLFERYYSLSRLVKLAAKALYVDGRKIDLWQGLTTTFRLFESEQYGKPLSIAPLGSGLFKTDSLGGLDDLTLDNASLLQVLKLLTTFENEQQQRVPVNYADLDVEEFGSVYEGLLEYDASLEKVHGRYHFGFVPGEDRSSSGSHYTPEELVKPLIDHSLEHLMDKALKENDPEKALLRLKIADIACGSGHILLSAARRLGTEVARVRTGEEQPAPTAIRQAVREVIRNCIYGVDKNPMAVELCKVALWLEAHQPGEPLNFLDHRIKCGDSLVGLTHLSDLTQGIADEAFKKLPEDDKEIASYFRGENKKQRKAKGQTRIAFEATQLGKPLKNLLEKHQEVVQLPETTPEEIAAKEKAYGKLSKGSGWWRLKTLADLQLTPFFLPKNEETKPYVLTDAGYHQALLGQQQPQAEGKAVAVAQEKGFFHWFLEFPQVMQEGGFDCILGNPPFLGGKRISGAFGDDYLNFLKTDYAPASGGLDLVVYFFKKIYRVIKEEGFQSLISTNTVAQGDSREGGLGVLVDKGASINHAVRSMHWPGLAAVEVALVTLHKGAWQGQFILNQKEVERITSYLDNSEVLGDPERLRQNADKSFQGSVVLGQGFVLDEKEKDNLLKADPKNQAVIFPYLNGQDLNSDPEQKPSRWVINFQDWPLRRYTEEEWNDLPVDAIIEIKAETKKGKKMKTVPPDYEGQVAADFPIVLTRVEELVKPERLEKKAKDYRDWWWHYGRKGIELYRTIAPLKRVMVTPRVTKTHAFTFFSDNSVYSEATVVIAMPSAIQYSVLQSQLHEHWAWKTSSTMKGDRRYSPTDAFQTFPFPQSLSAAQVAELEELGEHYHQYRSELMQREQEGLTKTYNRFHNPKEEEKAHIELRRLHQQLDEAVLRAYGWEDLIEQIYSPSEDKFAGTSLHGFYEVDYLPENDRVRFTFHPEARQEVLKRLLLLNHEVYAKEEEYLSQFPKNKRKGIKVPLPEWMQKLEGEEGSAEAKAQLPSKSVPKKPKAKKSASDGGLFGTQNLEQEAKKREQAIFDNFDEKYHPLVRELLDKGMNFNKDSYFTLRDEDDGIIATADLGIYDRMHVYGPFDEASRKVFEARGFVVKSLG